MRFLLILLLTQSLTAAVTIKGTLEDGTSGGPGSADMVRLVHLDQFMKTVGSVEQVSGTFEINYDGDPTSGRFLLQAIKGATTYSAPLADPNQPVNLKVFDNAPDVEINARVGSLALYAHEGGLDVGYFFNLDNLSTPAKTLVGSPSSFTFPMIEGYKSMEANTQRGGMPLKQNLTVEGNRAGLNYALKPGRTQLMVRFGMEYNPEGSNRYEIPLKEGQDFLHLLVLPTDLKVEGEGLAFVSTDKKNGASLYEWERGEAKGNLMVTVSGKPIQGDANAQNNQKQDQQDTGHKIERTPDKLASWRWYIIVPVVLALTLLAFVSLWKA